MSPRNFYGRMIGLDEAKPFIEAFHYSGSVPTGPNIFFGAFIDGDLYAVAAFGSGANKNQEPWLAKLTGLPVTHGNLTILKRLCRKGEKDDALDSRSRSRGEIPMTQFLAFCHRKLKEFFGIRYVMAYSDPAAGHDGGVYRAANFIHLGTTKSEQHVQDADGRIMHRRGVYHYRRRCGVETVAEVRDKLGLSLIMTPPKDRWFIDLSGEWPWPWLRTALSSANVVKIRKTTGVT